MTRNKKKIYEIIWTGTFNIAILKQRISLIVAKNEEQALKKFYKKYNPFVPSIDSFKEYKVLNEVLENE